MCTVTSGIINKTSRSEPGYNSYGGPKQEYSYIVEECTKTNENPNGQTGNIITVKIVPYRDVKATYKGYEDDGENEVNTDSINHVSRKVTRRLEEEADGSSLLVIQDFPKPEKFSSNPEKRTIRDKSYKTDGNGNKGNQNKRNKRSDAEQMNTKDQTWILRNRMSKFPIQTMTEIKGQQHYALHPSCQFFRTQHVAQ